MSPIVVGDTFDLVGGGEGASRWALFLAESSTMNVIGPLSDASGLSLDVSLNRPARMSFSYPMDGDFARDIWPIDHCVILVYNGEILWSGPILTIRDALPDEKISIVAVGWLELLYHRITREQVVYTSQTRGNIIHDLLAIANNQQDTWISPGANADDAPVISKTFEADVGIGQSIEEMTSIEASPDIDIHPEFRELNIKAWDDYADRTEVIWGYGWGPENLDSFARNVSAEQMINRITVYGKSGAIAGYTTEDTVSQSAYQLFESTVTLSSVGEAEVLAAYGEVEMVYKGTPRVTYEFQPAAGDEQPIIFRDFNIGDKCYLKAKYGNLLTVDQAIRVFSCNLSIDENGTPKMSNMVTVAS